MEEYSPDLWTLTDERLLATVSDDSDLYLQKMPGNCRNISDEVFPGIMPGQVVWPMRGNQGHGYDPIFQPDGYDITFGEMDRWEKNEISPG